MKKIILYGAGVRGKKVANLLKKKSLDICFFCDSNKAGEEIEVGEGKISIYSPSYVYSLKNKEEYLVTITIANSSEVKKIDNQLRMSGIEVITVEELLKNHELDMVANNREFIAEYHLDEMEDYYSIAESSDCLQVFWGANSEFRKRFSLLDLSNVIELACGHGRHVTQYINMADKITLVDILEENILYCQKRFGDNTKIDYYVNSGHDLKRLTSNSFSALFTYDAMVHFEMLDIFEYLKETYRILKIGGKALFHHSNNAEDYKITFSTGTSGRNYMSAQLFAYLSNRAGLKVVEQKIINWGKSKDLDCITLVEK